MYIVCTMHSSLCMHSTVSCITCMHFQCFKEKHCTLIVFHNRIFPKNWGAKCITGPPIRSLGGHGPLAPPRGGPHDVNMTVHEYSYLLLQYSYTLHEYQTLIYKLEYLWSRGCNELRRAKRWKQRRRPRRDVLPKKTQREGDVEREDEERDAEREREKSQRET